MTHIDLPKDTVGVKWRYAPELGVADTSTFNSRNYITSTVSTTASSEDLADAIANAVNRKIEEGIRIHGINGTFKGDENMEINGMVFKDIEKNLRKLGIDIITILNEN